MHLGEGLGMVGEICLHAIEDAEIIGMSRDLLVEPRDVESRFAVLAKFVGAPQEFAAPVATNGRALSVISVEARLVVEGIQVGRSPAHAEENDPFGLAGKVGGFWREWRGTCRGRT